MLKKLQSERFLESNKRLHQVNSLSHTGMEWLLLVNIELSGHTLTMHAHYLLYLLKMLLLF